MAKKQSNIKNKFTFIDLFAGIGGIRLALEKAGGKCVFSSEWNKSCQQTYKINFGDDPHGDIRMLEADKIPDHDLLAGGFPCQPFSIAGISKKNSLGKKHGFECEEQGNLFFEIARIIKAKKPGAFFLENVKNLKSHDRGNTYKIIRETLEKLGYLVFDSILDAKFYVPQHRERIVIIGFRKSLYKSVNFTFPGIRKPFLKIADILEKKVDDKYTLSDKLWNYLKEYAAKHREKGNGFGYGLVDPKVDRITRTLSARYYKDGSEILIKQNGKNPRRLTPRECARLMGFRESFKIPVSDTQAYKQFGNSVVVPLMTAVAKNLAKAI